MHPDPWPEIDRMAAEAGLDLTDARQLVESARSVLIDTEGAIGNTLPLHLQAGHSINVALDAARAEIVAAIDRQESGA